MFDREDKVIAFLPRFLTQSRKGASNKQRQRPSRSALRGAISFHWESTVPAQIAEHVRAHPPPQAAKRHSRNAKEEKASINTMSPKNLSRQLVSQDVLLEGAQMGRDISLSEAARETLQVQAGATRLSGLLCCFSRQLSTFKADTSNLCLL